MRQRDSKVVRRHLVITVHGIRTFGQWQERLEALVDTAAPVIEVHNYKYGYFSVAAFFIPFLRWLVTRRFRLAMIKYQRENWDRIDIVAHSFGTHLVGGGLYGIESTQRPHIHTIILAGSVLKMWFPWDDLMPDCVRRVVNDCGMYDGILVINQMFVLFTGMAGRLGFAGMTHDDFRNRFFPFGHSGYFEENGKPDNTFMRERWIPLLIGEGAIPSIDDPRSPTAVSGFQTFLLYNADPLKLALYVTPVIAAILWINGLRLEAVAQRSEAQRQEALAKEAAKVANHQRQIATAQAAGVQALRLSEQGHSDHLAERAAALALESWRLFRTPEAHAAADRLIKSLPMHRREYELASSVAFDAAGHRLAIASEGDSSSVTVIALDTGEKLHKIEHDQFVWDVAFHPNGRWLATASGYDPSGGTARVIDLATGRDLHRLEQDDPVDDLAFDPKGRLLVRINSMIGVGIVQAIDPETGQELYRIEYDEPVRAMAFDMQGRWLAIGSGRSSSDRPAISINGESGSARVIDAETGQELHHIDFGEPVDKVSFDPSGRWLATASGSSARVIDPETGQELYRLEHNSDVNAVAFDPTGRWLATADADGSVRVINPETGLELYQVHHGDLVYDVAFDPKGRWLATASIDGSARVIDPETGQELYRLEHGERVYDLTFDPNGRWLATEFGDDEVRARVVNVEAGQEFYRIEHAEPVQAIAFDPNGRRLATASGDWESGSVRVVSLEEDQGLRQFEQDWGVGALAFDSKGRRLASSSLIAGQVIDVETDQELYTLSESPVLAFDPKDRWLATARDKWVVLIDATSGDGLHWIEHDRPVRAMAFDIQGRWLAAASGDSDGGSVRVFDDPATGQELSGVSTNETKTA